MIDINLRGIDHLAEYFERQPAIADQAARLAVNYAIRRAATLSKRGIRDQVDLKASYIGSPTDKTAPLRFTRLAKPGDNTAVLAAAPRATSMARFATVPVTFGKQPRKVRVRIKRGKTKTLDKAFFVRLKRGNAAVTQDNYNLGLAVRLKPGETFTNKRSKGPQRGPGLGILYAPSVQQVFDDVSEDVAEIVVIDLEAEFLRQYRRLSRG